MADKTIPDLTTASLNTGYYFPFAIDASTEASKSAIGSLADFYKLQYIDRQIGTTTVDPIGITYGGWGIHGNLLVTGKFHASGTGYLDSIIAGSVSSITVGDPTSHVIGGTSSVIQNAPFCSIFGGVGSLIKVGSTQCSVLGGLNNVVESYTNRGVVLGGESNTAGGTNSASIGGILNNSTGSNSAIMAGNGNDLLGSSDSVILGGMDNIISGCTYSFATCGQNSRIFSSDYCSNFLSNSTVIRDFSKQSSAVGGIGSSEIIQSTGSMILNGFNNILSGQKSFILGASAVIPPQYNGIYILADSRTVGTRRQGKQNDSITLHFSGGAIVSGSSLEVERSGVFYGGVVMGTGKAVITASTGIATIPTFGIAPDAYSGYAISAPGVNTGDFVTISLQTYSGSAFGLPDGNLICFTPQPYFDQIRFYLYNPPGPSSISPPPNVRWLSYKTTLLGQI